MTVDHDIRARALDPTASFCVTAPAGSGKTGLLTQRVLALLARVERPDQVLAITFTRKAAAEMRERIAKALAEASSGQPVTDAHQQATCALAHAALAHGTARGWAMGDPEIFNIRTIDSLCHYLTRQMPLASGLGGDVAPVDDAMPLYEAAVDSLFASGFADNRTRGALSAVLLAYDNHWGRVRELLVGMLARRGDWAHRGLDRDNGDAAAAAMTATARGLITTVLSKLRDTLGGPALAQLASSAEQAIEGLAALRDAGDTGSSSLSMPDHALDLSASPEALSSWQWLSQLLLTAGKPSEITFRKQLNKNQGFPPSAKAEKAALQALIAYLAEAGDSLSLWAEVRALPLVDIHAPGWQRVLDLAQLLPQLEAHLLLVFKARSQVDHTHIALAAEAALGPDDAPTDLALRLDYQLEHILVDEFQDTSDTQFRLLERLTRDWASHNATGAAPRTVFLVGDGMQSIYRFRNADVGLFLRARDRGIGPLRLEPLALRTNFRSQAGLVHWVNRRFAQLLPGRDDPARGQIRHTEAEAFKTALPEPAVELHVFEEQGGAHEARWLVAQIAALRAREPGASIAVLGRTRGHLWPIVEALKAASVPLVGIDLDPLGSSMAVSDLRTLCRWLANPADGIAAVALLRAPFCGLRLVDIEALLKHEPRPFSLLHCLQQAPATLPDDAAQRIARLRNALIWAEQTRDRLSLAVWVEQVWLRLAGHAAAGKEQWPAVQQFFAVLDAMEKAGVGLDPDALDRWVSQRYIDHPAGDGAVELLTLHKSKGLEFDYVFMPALSRATRRGDRDLLRWHWHQGADSRGLLIAADESDGGSSEEGGKDAQTLYQYLTWLDTQKEESERRRLLYVGTTRAISRLWLSGEVAKLEAWRDGDYGSSLLGLLAESGDPEPQFHDLEVTESAPPASSVLRRLVLPASGSPEASATAPTGTQRPVTPGISVGNWMDRVAGTALHRALERLAGVQPLPTSVPEAVVRSLQRVLTQELSDGREGESLLSVLLSELEDVLRSDTGRWLLSAHNKAVAEWDLTLLGDTPQRLVIDRSFVEDGVRWIIDYKRSRPALGVAREDFLAGEVARYREQLARYAAAVARFDQAQHPALVRETRCALYFTTMTHLEVVPLTP